MDFVIAQPAGGTRVLGHCAQCHPYAPQISRPVQCTKLHDRRRTLRSLLHTVPAIAPERAEVSKTVDVDLGQRTYPIYIGDRLLDDGMLLQQHVHGKQVLIVTNETIAPLYLHR